MSAIRHAYQHRTPRDRRFFSKLLDATSGMRVPAISIDGYRQDEGIDRIDAMKMDVEGAEMLVLRGMQQTLQQAPFDLMVMEVLPESLSVRNIAQETTLQ